MSVGLLLLLLFCIIFPIIFWKYTIKIEEGDVFASNFDELQIAYVKKVTCNEVHYVSKGIMCCMKKKEFLKKFHKVHYYV